jgi:anaerobic selenocysteine-containing dehydrogenase
VSFKFDRRSFLKFALGGAAGTVTSGVSMKGISNLNAALANEQVRVPRGPESWATSVCTLCPGGCGLRVRLIGKRAVKIQGNPLHPISRGGLCPKGIAGLQELYHPDRLRKPMRNAGSRDNPRWKDISWEEALGTITGRLRTLRDGGEARSVVVLDRARTGLLPRLQRQFLAAYGSPNYFAMPTGMDGIQAAVRFQQGITEAVAYDLASSRYVLSFGVNLLEGWGAPVAVMRAFSRWRDTVSGRRTKLVQIEPRFSMTAARADEWVALRPRTDAALALGIAYALISEGLYDADFVREHTFGFEDWRDADGKFHLGFKSLVNSEYRLNDVATMTGVPADTILRLAREAAQNRPVVAIGGPQTSSLPGDPYMAMAVHSLNALLGSIDVPGGVLVQQSLPGASPDSIRSGHELHGGNALARSAAELPAAILARRPYAAQAVVLNQADPVFSLANGGEFRRALREVPFVVSFTSFMDDSSALADLVLPTATGLESWQDTGSPPTLSNALFAVSAPVVRPHEDVRHPGDAVLTLARSLGGQVAAALPFASYEAYLRRHVDELFAAQGGAVFGSNLEDTWNRLMERSGWWAPTYATSDQLWDQMKQQGGWWEPAYPYGEWGRVFRTTSGRFEFYSQALAEAARQQTRAAHAEFDERACLPHQTTLPEGSSNFPLLLLVVEQLPLSGGQGAHLPYLQQISGEHLFASWDSWLEIHPETAHQFGIEDGAMVWVESRRGRVQARARLFEGARPGVVHLPLGYGRATGSPWACRGANPLQIVEQKFDPLTALPLNSGTQVKVYRA